MTRCDRCDRCDGAEPVRVECEDCAYARDEARSMQATLRGLPRCRFPAPMFPGVPRDDCWGAA